MIRVKIKKEEWFRAPELEPTPYLPVPMPATVADAKRELAECEAREDWTRAAALRYGAIPWLGKLDAPDWEDVPKAAKPPPPTETAPQSNTPTYQDPDLPDWVPSVFLVGLWALIGIPLLTAIFTAMLTPIWGPIVTVRRGPGDHTGCLELFLSIPIWLLGFAPVWGLGASITRMLKKH